MIMANINLIILTVLIQILEPSMQVVVWPCKVERKEYAPDFATRLGTADLVQIVQIPPVFVQNVVIGRCVNSSEHLSDSGNFMCQQRYSAVELYTAQKLLPLVSYNTSKQDLEEEFRKGTFRKEFVVIESGCNFTINLLPVLNEIAVNNANRGIRQGPDTLSILPSPHHKNLIQVLPDLYSSSTSSPTEDPEPTQIPYNYDDEQNATTTTTTTTTTTESNVEAQGGNHDHNHNVSVHEEANYTPSSTTPHSRPSGSEHQHHHGGEHRGGKRRVQRGPQYTSTPDPIPSYTEHYIQTTPSSSKLQEVSSPSYSEEHQLYGTSDKIGMPLYILDSSLDPLRKFS